MNFIDKVVNIFKREGDYVPANAPTKDPQSKVNKFESSYQQLSFDQLFKIYYQTSTVRHCIDGIAAKIAYAPYNLSKENDAVREILDKPNFNGDRFSTFIWKFVVDLLIYDVGVIEKVRSSNGRLVELYTRDASNFEIKRDDHGIIEEIYQNISGEKIYFDFEDLVWQVFHPNNKSVYGCPLIESVVDEVASLIYSSGFIAETFASDSHPPGILNLGNLGKAAYDRAKAEFNARTDTGKRERVHVFKNVSNVSWIPLKPTLRESQIVELRADVSNIVYRTFGVPRAESHGDTPIAAFEVQDTAQNNRLVEPLMSIVEYFINERLIKEEFKIDDVQFKFRRPRIKGRYQPASARTLVFSGIETLNDIRSDFGLKPAVGGDQRMIVIGSKLYVFDENGVLHLVDNTNGQNKAIQSTSDISRVISGD